MLAHKADINAKNKVSWGECVPGGGGRKPWTRCRGMAQVSAMNTWVIVMGVIREHCALLRDVQAIKQAAKHVT